MSDSTQKIIHYLKQGGILLLEILLFAVLVASVSFVLYSLFGSIITDLNLFSEGEDELIARHPFKLLTIIYIPITCILLLCIWLAHSLILGREKAVLGFTKKGILRNLLFGATISAVIILIGFLFLFVFRQIEIINFEWNGTLIIGFLLMFCVQSFSEEIIFRAYLIPTIEKRLGTCAALVISSIGFMIIHLGNNNFTGLACANLILGGVLMGILFIKYRNVWAPTGMHIFWNYLQSTILGFEVSGEKTYSLIIQKDVGHSVLTGGDFGYEGSILSVIILVVSIIWLTRNFTICNINWSKE